MGTVQIPAVPESERVFGPIIEAVMAGHAEHGGKCVRCSGGLDKIDVDRGTPYPCEDILAARREQQPYARRLQRERAIAAGMLSGLEAVR